MKAALSALACLLALSGAGGASTVRAATPFSEVVVTLPAPSLAQAPARGLPIAKGTRTGLRAIDLRSLSSRRYLSRLDAAQNAVARRIEASIPQAQIRWRYRIVADGLAVWLPSSEVVRLGRVAGVARVFPSYRYYRPADYQSNIKLIGAPDLWGPTLASAGQGIKIGIIDDGIDQTHPYFNPSGYTMPAGFPKGNSAYTNAKVIVARAFAPPGLDYANASLPFDPKLSSHGTHVAGIAAGNANTQAKVNGGTLSLSGVAPRAYLGNYKAMTIPTSNFGLDGNSPELVAAIESAVSDGMNVINLSLGEPEIDPRNDIVAQALDAAAEAGVVSTVAAGNEFMDNGYGSIDSPGTAAQAITVAASTSYTGGSDRMAAFSSGGPTPFGLLLKPDVSAPGVDILSSVPASSGLWITDTGTSMAAPHVAGAAALLLQRHPDWTPAQIKSALVTTGAPVTANGREVSPLREGGGRIALTSADQPQVFASPTSFSFGFLGHGQSLTRSVTISDASSTPVGSCSVAIQRHEIGAGVTIQAPASVTVPGRLDLGAKASAQAQIGDTDGWVVLSCAGERLRLPFWLRLSAPQLPRKKVTILRYSGTHAGNNAKSSALVNSYLYPERAPDVPTVLKGPEQVFRLTLKKWHQNFGVAVVSQGRGVAVSPRIVRGTSEDRLAGLDALPINVNPYVDLWGSAEPVAGVLRPGPGTYEIVFDTVSAKQAGSFLFHLWIDDRTPPHLRVLSRKAGLVIVKITDSGAGVDPRTIAASSGSKRFKVDFDPSSGLATIYAGALAAHGGTLAVTASDYQESKNDENVGGLLPNTSTIRVAVPASRTSG